MIMYVNFYHISKRESLVCVKYLSIDCAAPIQRFQPTKRPFNVGNIRSCKITVTIPLAIIDSIIFKGARQAKYNQVVRVLMLFLNTRKLWIEACLSLVFSITFSLLIYQCFASDKKKGLTELFLVQRTSPGTPLRLQKAHEG